MPTGQDVEIGETVELEEAGAPVAVAGEDGGEAGVALEAEYTVDAGAAEVSVDEEGAELLLGVGEGEVDGGGGLALDG